MMKGLIKTIWMKRLFALNILIFTSLYASADFSGKLKNTVSKEFNSLTGIYIMGGLIGAGLLIYIITNYVFKEKQDDLPKDAMQHSQHNHLRHKMRHSHNKDIKKS